MTHGRRGQSSELGAGTYGVGDAHVRHRSVPRVLIGKQGHKHSAILSDQRHRLQEIDFGTNLVLPLGSATNDVPSTWLSFADVLDGREATRRWGPTGACSVSVDGTDFMTPPCTEGLRGDACARFFIAAAVIGGVTEIFWQVKEFGSLMFPATMNVETGFVHSGVKCDKSSEHCPASDRPLCRLWRRVQQERPWFDGL